MSTPKDGGAAFPTRNQAGMSLRDWFAGQVMNGWATNGWVFGSDRPTGDNQAATYAYQIADAMLRVRETM